jgi:hypothetical protein
MFLYITLVWFHEIHYAIIHNCSSFLILNTFFCRTRAETGGGFSHVEWKYIFNDFILLLENNLSSQKEYS